MRYFKVLDNGYIAGVQTVSSDGGGNITESEYNEILSIIHNRPTAPDGYGYRLREDLTWELYELPVVDETETEQYTEKQLAAMTNAELQTVLADMGISGTMTKANMITLITSKAVEKLLEGEA